MQSAVRSVVRLVFEACAQVESVPRAHRQIPRTKCAEEARDLPRRIRVFRIGGETGDFVAIGELGKTGIAQGILSLAYHANLPNL